MSQPNLMQVMKVTDPLPNRSCCMVLQASPRLSHVLSMSLLSFLKVSQVDLLVHWSCTTLGCEHTSHYRMSGPRATLTESVSDSLWLKHVVEEQGGGHFVGLWQRSPCFFSTVRLTSTLWRLVQKLFGGGVGQPVQPGVTAVTAEMDPHWFLLPKKAQWYPWSLTDCESCCDDHVFPQYF